MKKILILSGAGLSAESGIRTFRDSGGLWEEYNIRDVCTAEGFQRNRKLVLDFYNMRRRDIADKIPNTAHKMIADLKNKYTSQIEVVTQNVDDLLEKAGCSQVVHLHGTLTDARCEDCAYVFDIGYDPIDNKICPDCLSEFVRHNVVMFHEPAPMYRTLYNLIDETDLFVVIGTAGKVIDVAGIAGYYRHSILNNVDKDTYIDHAFTSVIHKPATAAADEIKDMISNFIQTGKL